MAATHSSFKRCSPTNKARRTKDLVLQGSNVFWADEIAGLRSDMTEGIERHARSTTVRLGLYVLAQSGESARSSV